MVDNKTIQTIMNLGFSENEAKAYIALLSKFPATAYEISRNSNIPTSKIYSVISKLSEKGVVQISEEADKKKYIPISPKEFIETQKNSFENTIQHLELTLPDIAKNTEISFIWNVTDHESLFDKAKRMINAALKTILISTWKNEITLLKAALLDAEERGVKIAIVHFGPHQIEAGQLYSHPIQDTLYQERGGRGFTLVCDSTVGMIGTISEDERVDGAWSESHGFITLAEDYIKHDIYIMKIVNRFDNELKETFGDGYTHLRNIFEDREVK